MAEQALSPTQETSMSKFTKIALILAVAAVAMAAKQLTWSDANRVAATSAASVSPAELMQNCGPLPETKVDSYY
jgi:hypothetical protein